MNETNKVTPIVVISGFLGSGKTTLLTKWIEYYKSKDQQVAVIMNELGDVNLDGLMIDENIPMAEMLSGCICCTIRGDLSFTIMELVEKEDPDIILIESTGAANPLELIDGVTEASLYSKIHLQRVVIIVDGPHLLELAAKGVGKTYKLMLEQIRCADIILLNKLDMVESNEYAELQRIVRDHNSTASLIGTIQCDIDPALLDPDPEDAVIQLGHESDHIHKSNHEHKHDEVGHVQESDHHHKHDHVQESGHHHKHDHAQDSEHHHAHELLISHTHHSHDHVMVYTHYFAGAVDSVRFEQFIGELPHSVYRAKGVLRFTDTPADSRFLFQYAYRETDYLRITPKKETPDVLVLIGEHIPKAEIKSLLEELERQPSEYI